MAEQMLMEKAGELMNVPGARVDEFLAAGWQIVKRAAVPADAPLALSEPEPQPAPEASPKPKQKAGSK